jgi:predicted lysophospholipase L1 biosynthesis ABC-type transport system permease subunit
MNRRRSIRYLVEVALAITSAILFVATLAVRDWIEIVFRVDPDRGSGALEWAIAASFLCAAVAFSLLAHRRLRRAPPTRARRDGDRLRVRTDHAAHRSSTRVFRPT